MWPKEAGEARSVAIVIAREDGVAKREERVGVLKATHPT
jgi:hypothetical protein